MRPVFPGDGPTIGGEATPLAERARPTRYVEWALRLSGLPATISVVPVLGPLEPVRALGLLGRVAERLMRAARADHATLNERTLRSYGALMTHAFLHAAVAPSRRIRPAPPDEFAERAAALAGALGVPTTPYLAAADTHRFAETDERGWQMRSLVVTRSGVLELLWPLEQYPTDDGAWAVHAVDACTQLARFARLVSGDDYSHILASSRLRRLLHTRVDWTLGVTTTAGEHGGARGWRDIHVVGAQPARASGHTYGFMSPSGYGTDKLRGIKRSRNPETVLKAMLADWLHANGYLRTASAIDATVAAAMAAA